MEDQFNAFDSNGFGYKLNIEGLFYEPLLMFNNLKANTAYPWLATDFAWNADGTQITFTIRDGVKFSDGSPLTADDVAYTFQVMKDTPATNRNGLPIDNAKVDGTNKVTVTFTAPQFQNLYNIAGQTFVVKKAAYSASPDPSKFADPKPVGTGPYTLANFTAQGLQFKANPNYWGGKPTVPEVDVPRTRAMTSLCSSCRPARSTTPVTSSRRLPRASWQRTRRTTSTGSRPSTWSALSST